MTDDVISHAYNSLWQLRADAWSSLEETSERLADGVALGRRREQLTSQASALFGLLDSIESYWAFPGGHRFERARRLFDAGDFTRLARLVAAINQALVTDSYRSGVSWRVAEGEDDGDDRDLATEEITPTRPYFEVLIVDDMRAEQEAALREELRKLRRPEDEFIYELVVVPSFDDAVVAVLFNFNLQACVIRRRFTRHSRRDLTPLSRFVEITGDEDLMERTPEERAQMLGDRISTLRPELDLYLMTDVSVEEIAGRLSQHFRRVFHAREGSLELHLSLLGGVRQRYRAPFFNALRDYSQKPTGVNIQPLRVGVWQSPQTVETRSELILWFRGGLAGAPRASRAGPACPAPCPEGPQRLRGQGRAVGRRAQRDAKHP